MVESFYTVVLILCLTAFYLLVRREVRAAQKETFGKLREMLSEELQNLMRKGHGYPSAAVVTDPKPVPKPAVDSVDALDDDEGVFMVLVDEHGSPLSDHPGSNPGEEP